MTAASRDTSVRRLKFYRDTVWKISTFLRDSFKVTVS